MAGIWCSSCGEPLGAPGDELHDPEGKFDPDNLGVIENPDSYHLKAIYSEKGVRLQCANTGKMAKISDVDPSEENSGQDKGAPSGTGEGSKNQPRRPKGGGDVYDTQKETEASDILKDVVTNPSYDLSEQQIEEVKDWGEIFDYQIPPGTLEDILGNLSGISKQKAKLMRDKYEAKLNKWIQEQSSSQAGPAIGASAAANTNTGTQTGIKTPSKPSSGGESQQKPQPRQQRQKSGREKRTQRRKNRRDKVADRMAEKMAENVADDVGMFYSDLRNIATTVLKRKAEKDPDWFLEKADTFGMDIIDELSEPSEAKKKQMENQQHPQADSEVDQAVQELMEEENKPQPPPETETQQDAPNQQEQVNEQPQQNNSEGLEQMVSEHKDTSDTKTEEEEFEQMFGELNEEGV